MVNWSWGFYTPHYKNMYGSDNYGWESTPLVKETLDPEIPQGVYTSFLAHNGLGGMDRKSEWARGMYGRTQSGYQAALRENPDMSYLEYLRRQLGGGKLDTMWQAMAPEQRGEQVNRWVGGGSRVIPWG